MLTKDQVDFYNDRVRNKKYQPIHEVQKTKKKWIQLEDILTDVSDNGQIIKFGPGREYECFSVDSLMEVLKKHLGQKIMMSYPGYDGGYALSFAVETPETTEEYEKRMADFEKQVVRDYNHFLKSKKMESYSEVRDERIEKLKLQINKLQNQLKDEQNRANEESL